MGQSNKTTPNFANAPDKPLVGIVMGSDSDLPVMQEALGVLTDFGIPAEITVASAHRSPHLVAEYAGSASARGLKVLIAGAGGAAHLAGVLAAATNLPVIGVPIASSPLQGWDALLATVQMPAGVPVATMAIGSAGARNAAILATQILALADNDMKERLRLFKEELAAKVSEKAAKLQEKLGSPSTSPSE
jgi:phosphoribosylaminoimidazole carboxylase PurE protein